MEEFILNYHSYIMGISIFLFITIVGYYKENKSIKGVVSLKDEVEDNAKKTFSISELEKNENIFDIK